MAKMVDLTQKIKKLAGHTQQGFAGTLLKESQFVWRYETTKRDCELSLAMPLRAQTYNSNQAHPIFAMNLPEGDQFHRLSKRFAKEFSKFDEMAILSIVGHDQIGRVQLTTEQTKDRLKKATVGLKEILKTKAHEQLFDYLTEFYYDAGISGAQPKVLIPDADVQIPDGRATARASDLIIKTGGAEYAHLSQNEYVCMLAAKKAGIEVPEFHLSEDGSLFIMRRFDLLKDGTRLGFEDFSVLGNTTYDKDGKYKYQSSYETVCKLLGAYCGQNNPHQQRQKFFEYFVLSCMVRNGDAHLKNFGLLYPSPNDLTNIRLAPLFDVVTTSAYNFEDQRTGRMMSDRSLALKLNKSNSYPTREELINFGKTICLVSRPGEIFDRIGQAMSEVMNEHFSLFPTEFGNCMAQEWETGRQTIDGSRLFFVPRSDETSTTLLPPKP
jgi:serine/threonine-protein kinase HipA